MSLLAQFIDGSHVLVIMQRRLYSGSASDSVVAGDSGHSSCATEKGTRLAAVLVMATVKGFFEVFPHISRSSGLSRSLAPVFGALEEFFVLEGSLAQLARTLLT